MRVRINFQKKDEIVYSSALDLQKIWERSIRRAQLKVRYSEGFHPQPKIQLAVPLPLGFLGRQELIDIWFVNDYPKEEIMQKLSKSVPNGIYLNSIEEIPDNQKALNGLAESAEYIVYLKFVDISFSSLKSSIHDLLIKKSIERERNNKHYDLRPLIITLGAQELSAGSLQIVMKLLAQSGSSGRPDEVLRELGIDPALCEIVRIKVNFRN
jgi:radical SAM-linked protein